MVVEFVTLPANAAAALPPLLLPADSEKSMLAPTFARLPSKLRVRLGATQRTIDKPAELPTMAVMAAAGRGLTRTPCEPASAHAPRDGENRSGATTPAESNNNTPYGVGAG